MPDICLYFQVHQPHRLLAGKSLGYRDKTLDKEILDRVSEQCYLPANQMFMQRIEESEGRFRMAMSLSGTLLEQLRDYRPDVLESFQELVATNGVELLAETYYHSLAWLYSEQEFQRQCDLHLDLMEELFHVRPRVFRNSELIYNDVIAARVESLGFDGILAEGIEAFTEGVSPNYVYRAPDCARIKTLLRNQTLSDDLAFRFSNPNWSGFPLTWEKFTSWVGQTPGDLVNLFMNYESIGEHHKREQGIYKFWEKVPEILIQSGSQWVTPSDAVAIYPVKDEYSCEQYTSWSDKAGDLSAWVSNPMQHHAIDIFRALESRILEPDYKDLLADWGILQTSDFLYWMSTKGGDDGKLTSYFSPYANANQAYEAFLSAVKQIAKKCKVKLPVIKTLTL